MDLNKFIEKKPFVIAGPCSAESEKQLHEIANDIKDCTDVFRAGIWKPRTNSASFQGIGKEALIWMKQVKQKNKIKVSTEVATAKHVEMCLEFGVDMLWIGARTTVNPFYVQEIAEALSGLDIPVFVKNPIHPELSLWIGAFERLNKKGIKNLAAIHRGFFTYESSAFRNDPKWEIPIELKRQFPELPIICDPSHIAGNNSLIPEISQIAMDLDMSGLMIETHNNPFQALSDSEQQIKPKKLKSILERLVLRKKTFKDKFLSLELNSLREKIDIVDKKIIETLNLRTDLVEEIAKFKLENNITIFQLERWFEILYTRKEQAKKLEMDPKMTRDLFELIHKYSILIQTKKMKQQ